MEWMQQLSLHRWTQRHRVSIGVAVPVHQIAVMADQVYELVILLRDGTIDRLLPERPPLNEWLGLYRSHRRVWRRVGDAFPTFHGAGRKTQRIVDEARFVSRCVKHHPKIFWQEYYRIKERQRRQELIHAVKEAKKWYREHLREMKSYLAGEEDGRDFGKILIRSPELHFYLRVVLPCLVEFETHPLKLLRIARDRKAKPAARAGAIENLLRLDDALVHDRGIAQWLHSGAGEVRLEKKKMAATWMKEGLNGRFTRQGVKASFAGLISAFAERFGFRWIGSQLYRYTLTARQILELFNAAALDRSRMMRGEGHEEPDEDLKDLNLESMVKRIQRHRRLWLPVLG